MELGAQQCCTSLCKLLSELREHLDLQRSAPACAGSALSSGDHALGLRAGKAELERHRAAGAGEALTEHKQCLSQIPPAVAVKRLLDACTCSAALK